MVIFNQAHFLPTLVDQYFNPLTKDWNENLKKYHKLLNYQLV